MGVGVKSSHDVAIRDCDFGTLAFGVFTFGDGGLLTIADNVFALTGEERVGQTAISAVKSTGVLRVTGNTIGGVNLRVKWDTGPGTFTSVTAWRFWDWKPANDRDFIGLPITTSSNNPTQQDQLTQEFRYAWANDSVDFVVGLFGFKQALTTAGVQGVKVNLPKAGSPATAKKIDEPKIQAITVDNSGNVKLNASVVSIAELETQLGAIKAKSPKSPIGSRHSPMSRVIGMNMVSSNCSPLRSSSLSSSPNCAASIFWNKSSGSGSQQPRGQTVGSSSALSA